MEYGHWAESNIIVGISIAALICAFFAGGLTAFDDQATRKRKEG
ncbi:putative membrane protein (plasmid) [Pseudomonas aeruginosa]|nr:putative membrane protein [Pseudomonas aeruginosa]